MTVDLRLWPFDRPLLLALALVLRLRDIICGLPLLYWPLLEYRHLARPR